MFAVVVPPVTHERNFEPDTDEPVTAHRYSSS
jgi:hypothetical protein